MCTVEPLNKGHIGTSYLVCCRDVVFSLEVKNVLVLQSNLSIPDTLDPKNCPDYRGVLISQVHLCTFILQWDHN